MKFKYSIITLVTGIVFILAFFVSVLGENHKIDDLISAYISNLEEKEFSDKCIPVSINSELNNESSCNQDNFVFFMSLLKRFNIFTAKNYSVKITRDNFWIPFYSDDTVKVSLSLLNSELEEDMGIFDEYEYISNIFIFKRQDLRWELHEISIIDPDLIKIFNDIKQNLNFNKYIKNTPEGYIFNNVEVNINNITNVDKLLLKFNLQKINNALN